MLHGTEEQKQRWLPAHGDGRAARGALAVGARRRQRHPQHLLPGRARRRRSTSLNGTKAWVTNGERASIVALAARTSEGISAFIVEKEPGSQLRGHQRSAATSASWATRASRPSRWPTSTTGSRPPTCSASRAAASPRSSSVLEIGRINIAARAVGVARAAFDAALAVRPGSAPRSASRSPSTRRSS